SLRGGVPIRRVLRQVRHGPTPLASDAVLGCSRGGRRRLLPDHYQLAAAVGLPPRPQEPHDLLRRAAPGEPLNTTHPGPLRADRAVPPPRWPVTRTGGGCPRNARGLPLNAVSDTFGLVQEVPKRPEVPHRDANPGRCRSQPLLPGFRVD